MATQQESTQQHHDMLQSQLAKLAIQEERLIDLAADGALPQTKIRSRLNKLALDRKTIEERLGHTTDELAVGAELLTSSLRLSRDPHALYRQAPDDVRRLINETFYERFFVDEHGLVADQQYKAPFDELGPAAIAYQRTKSEKAPSTAGGPFNHSSGTALLTMADVFLANGSSKAVLVGVTGFEPAASSSRTKRPAGILADRSQGQERRFRPAGETDRRVGRGADAR
jgi:site-specific DNA recombinase